MDKKKISAKNKAWREANKGYMKEYRKANKERESSRDKAYNEANKLGYHIVYALPNFNESGDVYCGMTTRPKRRMSSHHSKGRNTKGWFVLDVVETKREALDIERMYHDNGYKGINDNYKKK